MNTLMRALEFATARHLLKEGPEAVFMDGSYVSVLLAPSGIVRSAYREVVQGLSPSEKKGFEELARELIASWLELVEGEELKNPAAYFELFLYKKSELEDLAQRKFRKALPNKAVWRSLLDYICMVLEENFALFQLVKLLEEARSSNTVVFWLAKDADSSFISKELLSTSRLTDASLLEYLWGRKELVCLRVSELVEIPRVSPWRAAKDPNGRGGDLVFHHKLAVPFYESWGSYEVWYAKYAKYGPVLQISYPSSYGASAGLKALHSLTRLIDERYGYPKPMLHVHHSTVLEKKAVETVADAVWLAEKDPLKRAILGRSGRKLVGL